MANELPSLFPAAIPSVVAVVMIHDAIVADATASSGKNAKVKASQKAVELLDGLLPYEFREKFGCNCESTKVALDADRGGEDLQQAGSAI